MSQSTYGGGGLDYEKQDDGSAVAHVDNSRV